MLLRLAYLGITNVFALLRLLPRSDHDKDTEILVLRHQLGVLQRQVGDRRVRFHSADRALLAALLHRSADPCYSGCGCWSVRTRSFAGAATYSPAATPSFPDLAVVAGPERCAQFALWC